MSLYHLFGSARQRNETAQTQGPQRQLKKEKETQNAPWSGLQLGLKMSAPGYRQEVGGESPLR
jgi:hypothetical protein